MNDSENTNYSLILKNSTFNLTQAEKSYSNLRDFEPQYRLMLLSTLFLASLSFFLGIFIIIYKSTPEMKKYEWFLINIISTSYCLSLVLNLWMPVPIFRIYGGYNIGLFREAANSINYIFLAFLLLVFANLLLSFLSFLLYQTMTTKLFAKWKIFSSSKAYFALYFSILTSFSLLLIVPLYILHADEATFEKATLKEHPNLAIIFENEKYFGFVFNFDSTNIVIFFFISLFLIYFSLVTILNAKIVSNISYLKSHLTKRVWKLQRSLYITFAFQTACSIILIFGPILFIFIMASIDSKTVYLRSTTGIIIMSIQPPICCIIMIFTIKPYRRFVVSLFFKKRVTPVS